MITVAKCPLRISLAGGSTDLQAYLDVYKKGQVVSFTPDLYTYIILKKSPTRYYKIIYSKIENVLTSEEIQNDIARVVLTYFNMPPVEIVFTADISSTGSGLASSSSYLISLIKACLEYKAVKMSDIEIGKIAIELERTFNPLTGYQDVWGCLLPGFKRIHFTDSGFSNVDMLPIDLFSSYDFYLIPTGLVRSSTNILATLNYEEVHKLANTADKMIAAITEQNYDEVLTLINVGWAQKKQTSATIMTPQIRTIESKLSNSPGVVAWRLIGAGCGGYFLTLVEKNNPAPAGGLKINLVC